MSVGRGYLGKISAVVAANTGSYVRGLNESAASTRSFASSISSDLRRAESDVNRSINSILTPIQRYERAIQNAADRRLAFRGFSGAIASVEDLRRAIGRLSDRPTEIDFIVRQSGLRNITEVRDALSGLRQSEIDLAVNVGGVDGLRRLRAEVEEVDGRLINVRTEVSADRLDQLIEQLSAFSTNRIQALQVAVETRELQNAVQLSDRLRSVAFEITDAYGRAKAQFAGFSAEVQSALGPAITQTDSQVENLVQTIERSGDVGDAEFRRIAAAAAAATRAIGETSEIQSRLASLKTGRELAFSNPRLDDALSRAQRASDAAAALPAGRRSRGDVGELVTEINRLANAAGVAEAAVAGVTDPARFAAARREADRLRAELVAATELLEGELPVKIDADQAIRDTERLRATLASIREEATFKVTGEFQNLTQAESAARQLVSELDKLGAQQASSLAPGINDLLAAIELGDIQLIRQEYAKLKADFDGELEIKVNADEANRAFLDAKNARIKDANDLRESLIRLADGINPSQPIDILEKNLNEAKAAVDRLDPKLKQLGRQDLARVEKFIRDSATQAGGATDSDINRAANAAGRVRNAAVSLAPAKPAGQPARDPLGAALGTSERSIENVRNRITSLQNGIDALPRSIASKFIPEVNRLRTAFQNIGPKTAAADIDALLLKTREVEKQVKLTTQANEKFGNTFAEFSQQQGIDSYSKKLDFLRRQLATVPGGAGAAEAALDKMAETARLAASEADGFTRYSARLKQVEADAVKASASVLKVNPQTLATKLKNAGDVSRGGADKASLALQQAAFAVEDFFSVTGGLDQRVRAAGNNISQLGFIVGGTTGLVLGISAAIGGQLVASLIKWLNGGRSTENMTKALNDAMERQKSIAQELATAFQSLGDTIATRGFSPATAAANEFAEKLKEINRLQAQAAEGSLAATSQGVQNARGSQNAIRERLEGETNVGRRIALIRQLAEAQRNERDITQRVTSGPTSPLRLAQIGPREDFVGNNTPIAGNVPTGQEIASFFERVAREAEQRAAGRQGFRRTQDDISGSTEPEFRAAATQLRDFARNLDLGGNAQAISSQADALQQAIELFKGAASRTALSFSTEAANEASAFIGAFEELRQRILSGFNEQTNATINESLTTADAASKRLEEAQKAVQESIQQGVDGSEGLASNLDEISQSIKRSTDAINQAIQGVDGQGRTIERTPAQVRSIADRERGNTANQLEEATRVRDEIARRAEDARFERTVNPQRRTQAIVDQAQQNLSSAGAETGAIARRLREIQFQREGLQRARNANEPQSNEAIDRQVRELLAASDALRRFTEALNAAASEAASNLGSAQQRADEARRADLGRSTPDTVANRAQADRDLREQQQANARVQDAIAAERARVEQQALDGGGALAGVFERLQAIKEETDAGNVSVQRQLELVAERRRLEEQVNAEIAKGNAVTAARDASTGINERQAAEARGRELSLTDAQKAAQEMQAGVSDINAHFDRMAKNIRESQQGVKQQADLLQNAQQRQAAVEKLINDQERAAAPMVFEMLDAAANVLAQGPRREALGAVDASTLEGQRELNRLIRGDDPAKDVNVIELRKQTQILKDIRDKKVPIAN